MRTSLAAGGLAVLLALSLPAAHGSPSIPGWVEQEDTSPAVRISAPAEGDLLHEDQVELRFHVENFTLNASAIGKANVAGEGYASVTVDGAHPVATGATELTVHGLEPGHRTIKVELMNNDGTALDPPVHDEISVHYEEPPPHLSVGHPAPAAEVNTFEVEVEFHLEHFVLAQPGSGPNTPGQGHIRWRVLKDGAPVTADPEVLWKASHTHAELKAPGCTMAKCGYTLEAWLANNDGSMVDGTEKHTVGFTVLPPDFGPVLTIGFTLLILTALMMVWAARRRPGEGPSRKRREKDVEGLSGD